MPTRPLTLSLALCVLLVATMIVVLVRADGDDAAPGPDRTSTPSEQRGLELQGATPLIPGSDLHLIGSGLPPDLGIVVVPCGEAALGRSSPTACDYRHAHRTTSSSTGDVDFAFPAVRFLAVDDEPLDCASAGCAITVLALTEPTTELHRQNLVFGEQPADAFEVRVEPTDALRHLERVQVDGSWEQAVIELCAGSQCDVGSSVEVRGGAVSVALPSVVVTSSGELRSCTTGACVVRVTTDKGVVETPVAFLTTPPAALVADVDQSAETLVLSNLLGTWYRPELCEVAFLAAPGETVRCAPATSDRVWGPATAVRLSIDLPSFCSQVCELRVSSGAGEAFATLIDGHGEVEPTPAELTAMVEPLPAVGGFAEFVVEGTDEVSVAQCHTGATDLDAATCGPTRSLVVGPDSTVRVRVRDGIEIEGTTVSCNAFDQLCAVLAVADDHLARVPVKAKQTKPESAAQVARDDAGVWVLESVTPLIAQRCTSVGRCEPPVLLDADTAVLLDAQLDPLGCACMVRVGARDGSLQPITDVVAAS